MVMYVLRSSHRASSWFCDQDDDNDGGEGMMKTITFAILTGMISEIIMMLLKWKNL